MPKLKIRVQTVAKRSPANAAELSSMEKATLTPGEILDCTSIERDGNHYEIVLKKARRSDGSGKGYHNWFIYVGHASLIGEGVSEPVLISGVPFFPQTDNIAGDPSRTCNSSVHAMLVEYLKPGTLQVKGRKREDDDYIQRLAEFGDTTDHGAHTRLLSKLGIKSSWRNNLTFEDLNQQLAESKPVPLGIMHRGPASAPTGGHIILAIGWEDGSYICHDPFGSLHDGYLKDVSHGREVRYSQKLLFDRWQLQGKNNGWGRILG